MTIGDDLRALGPAAERLGWVTREALAAEVAKWLPRATWALQNGHSRLNGNGSPLEICLSARAGRVRGRVLLDPCPHLRAEARFREAWRVALECASQRAPELVAQLEDTRRWLTASVDPQVFVNGPLWLATCVDAPGLAIYFDARPLGAHASEHILDWLNNFAPAALDHLAPLLREDAGIEFSSFGLEGSCAQDLRAKLYFRLGPQTALTSLGPRELHDPALFAWLEAVLPKGEISPSGLVASVSVNLAQPQRSDAKIDICGHCVGHSLPTWDSILKEREGPEGLPSLEAHLDPERVDVAFAGFGITSRGERRTNIYLHALR